MPDDSSLRLAGLWVQRGAVVGRELLDALGRQFMQDIELLP